MHEAALLKSGSPPDSAVKTRRSSPNCSASRSTSRHGASSQGSWRPDTPATWESANGAVIRATQCSSTGTACADSTRTRSPATRSMPALSELE